VKGSVFDEAAMFRAIAESAVRALLIGRRALIAIGLPVMTRDYDYWIHADDAALFNDTLHQFDMFPTKSPEQARIAGRYALENDEHVDVLVAKAVGTIDGDMVAFDDVWSRWVYEQVAPSIRIALPCLDDLIATKKFGQRPRDADDIRWLLTLRATRQ
jgi:hypothetical protein